MNSKYKTIMMGIIAGLSGLLLVNLLLTGVIPDWNGFVSDDVLARMNSAFSGTKMLHKPDSSIPPSAQGGVNLQRARDVVEDVAQEAEGEPQPEVKPAETTTPSDPAAETPQKPSELTEAEKTEIALRKFQNALVDHDVIHEGQDDLDRSYISKSFKDNPFDPVQEAPDMPDLMGGIPPPPLYPPPDEAGSMGTEQELKDYLKTITLQGVVQINNKNYAFIDTGAVTYMKTDGDSFKDRITINIDEVSTDAVLLSDEFKNQAFIDFSYRKGFEVQPVDDVIYITNLGSDLSLD